ncbi:FtsX-like permease family protein [Thermanaerosceptrum fracticalcis]|uniref:FtsX-like permease family protein n=1 Tax=Thermanaerosceptrum fracticalcis TaxID=1712410 RepID=A0A7G6E7S7_THEFR|nr:ABC transporter permease [Thermanaerosceptrum fracticalcis]QNB48131.1 FtsX-like permease family protein [Thermanaerosceptrum fracticalcis]
MNKLDILKLAHRNLWRRKARTILTVVGVMIGTTAIVVMLSLGIGLKESQRKSMERWGDLNMIRVQQGINFDREGKPLGEAKKLDDAAVAEIKAIEGVMAVSPAYESGGEAKFGRKRGHIQLIGIDPEEMVNLEFTASLGRLLKAGDRNVMVVGSQVINNFRDEAEIRKMQRGMMFYEGPRRLERKDPGEMMDQRIAMEIRNNSNHEKKRIFNFQVVGVLEGEFKQHAYQAYAPIEDIKRMRKFMMEGTQNGGGDPRMMREIAMKTGGEVRATSSSRRPMQGYDPDDYNFLLVRTEDVTKTREVSDILRERGYNTYSIADQLEGIEKTSRTIQAILGGIGGITLLVAAIGITNTMIMSIYERTKEIGIMKVIGATFQDIHAMFLAEAGLIGLMGGTIGLGLSYLVSYIINHFSRNFMSRGLPPGEEVMGISLIPPYLALFAMAFAFLIGVIAGLYPANRAVRLSPINAIRNE